MAKANFPASPTNGQTVVIGGITYIYNSSKGIWRDQISNIGNTSDTPPANAVDGQLWYNSSNGALYVYYDDGTSTQWVGVSGPAGAAGAAGAAGSPTSYANLAAFPSSGNTAGDFGFANDTKAIYVWDGTEWDRMYTDTNAVPEWTTAPASSANLAIDGTATNQTNRKQLFLRPIMFLLLHLLPQIQMLGTLH